MNDSPAIQDEEVVLRLGDILPRIPAQTLKPGPHDTMRPIRLPVEELAEQISRGRASISLARLGSVCPDIFHKPEDLPAGEEVALPLQRLLAQIGLKAGNPSSYGDMPKEQVDQARAEAARILREAHEKEASLPPPPPAVAETAAPPQDQTVRPGKLFSAAKQFFSFLGGPPPAAAERISAPVNEAAPPKQEMPVFAEPPEGFISLRLRPIFRLLPNEVLQGSPLPPDEARANFPLSLIDPQLASGHVEIPLEEFSKALPEELRGNVRQAPGVEVWIPLDEIFQSLPSTHFFYMPPLEELAEPAVEPEPVAEAEATPAALETEPVEAPAAETAAPAPAKHEAEPEIVIQPETEAQSPSPPEAEPEPAPPSRAPWMRGFVVPPPRVFPNAIESSGQSELPPVEVAPPAKTPEAKQTADFLAGQPGIFAAAAFVQGAIFASEDFPRKPDLDTLREVIGAFVETAQAGARQLGWNRVLTLACEKFFVTAVVRDKHFIVVLHHDRVLPPVAYEALLGTADDLGNS